MRNGRTGRLRSPRDLAPRLEVARASRTCGFCEARGLSPRGEVVRAMLGRGLTSRLRVARAWFVQLCFLLCSVILLAS